MVQMIRTQVLGTCRKPDGDSSAAIDGLVIAQPHRDGGWTVIEMATALEMALGFLLWCDRGGRQVEVEAVDQNGDGRVDYLRTLPDGSPDNNLLRLDIWDRTRRIWFDYRGRQKAA